MAEQEPVRIVMPQLMGSACAALGAKLQACVDLQKLEYLPQELRDAAAVAVHNALTISRPLLDLEQALDDVLISLMDLAQSPAQPPQTEGETRG